jgi:hypothetical protein
LHRAGLVFQVREKLITKELAMEKSEKARKLRAMKKYGKKVMFVTVDSMTFQSALIPN